MVLDFEKQYHDLLACQELLKEQHDPALLSEMEQNFNRFEVDFRNFELKRNFTGKYDFNNAYVSIHPGAGGTESQDWASMLLRMYLRWMESKGYDVETLDYQVADEAGIKSVSLWVKGPWAFGFLKVERGVHRLVRISPFDANKRRHTSFSSVDVMPEVEDVEIHIDPKDLKIDVMRSGGPGSQSVNTTDSAVRIHHLPSGLIVHCQQEKSQHKNKAMAMNLLRSKLYAIEEEKRQSAERDARRGQIGTGDRSEKIRTYNFPQDRLTDHRIGLTKHNLPGIMDGDVQDVFDSLRAHFQAEALKQAGAEV